MVLDRNNAETDRNSDRNRANPDSLNCMFLFHIYIFLMHLSYA
jgi:hypothetical protein